VTFEEFEREFYEDLYGRVVAVRLAEGSYHLDFECDHWREQRRIGFTISRVEVVESTVSVGCVDEIHQSSDHPLLWEWCQPYDSLFFSSPTSNPFELLGRLYDVHHRTFDDYRTPSRYFQTNAELLRTACGKLASGPRSAVALYHEVAEPLMRCSLVPGPERTTSYETIFFNESYVICRSFHITNVAELG
jgi:hypothetical protein